MRDRRPPDDWARERSQADHDHRWWLREREVEARRHEPAPVLCSICNRSLEAVPDCAICGDHEDMAA